MEALLRERRETEAVISMLKSKVASQATCETPSAESAQRSPAGAADSLPEEIPGTGSKGSIRFAGVAGSTGGTGAAFGAAGAGSTVAGAGGSSPGGVAVLTTGSLASRSAGGDRRVEELERQLLRTQQEFEQCRRSAVQRMSSASVAWELEDTKRQLVEREREVEGLQRSLEWQEREARSICERSAADLEELRQHFFARDQEVEELRRALERHTGGSGRERQLEQEVRRKVEENKRLVAQLERCSSEKDDLRLQLDAARHEIDWLWREVRGPPGRGAQDGAGDGVGGSPPVFRAPGVAVALNAAFDDDGSERHGARTAGLDKIGRGGDAALGSGLQSGARTPKEATRSLAIGKSGGSIGEGGIASAERLPFEKRPSKEALETPNRAAAAPGGDDSLDGGVELPICGRGDPRVSQIVAAAAAAATKADDTASEWLRNRAANARGLQSPDYDSVPSWSSMSAEDAIVAEPKASRPLVGGGSKGASRHASKSRSGCLLSPISDSPVSPLMSAEGQEVSRSGSRPPNSWLVPATRADDGEPASLLREEGRHAPFPQLILSDLSDMGSPMPSAYVPEDSPPAGNSGAGATAAVPLAAKAASETPQRAADRPSGTAPPAAVMPEQDAEADAEDEAELLDDEQSDGRRRLTSTASKEEDEKGQEDDGSGGNNNGLFIISLFDGKDEDMAAKEAKRQRMARQLEKRRQARVAAAAAAAAAATAAVNTAAAISSRASAQAPSGSTTAPPSEPASSRRTAVDDDAPSTSLRSPGLTPSTATAASVQPTGSISNSQPPSRRGDEAASIRPGEVMDTPAYREQKTRDGLTWFTLGGTGASSASGGGGVNGPSPAGFGPSSPLPVAVQRGTQPQRQSASAAVSMAPSQATSASGTPRMSAHRSRADASHHGDSNGGAHGGGYGNINHSAGGATGAASSGKCGGHGGGNTGSERSGCTTPQLTSRATISSQATGLACSPSPSPSLVLPIQPSSPGRVASQSGGTTPTLHSKFAGLRDEMKRRRSSQAFDGSRFSADPVEVAEAVLADASASPSMHQYSNGGATPVANATAPGAAGGSPTAVVAATASPNARTPTTSLAALATARAAPSPTVRDGPPPKAAATAEVGTTTPSKTHSSSAAGHQDAPASIASVQAALATACRSLLNPKTPSPQSQTHFGSPQEASLPAPGSPSPTPTSSAAALIASPQPTSKGSSSLARLGSPSTGSTPQASYTPLGAANRMLKLGSGVSGGSGGGGAGAGGSVDIGSGSGPSGGLNCMQEGSASVFPAPQQGLASLAKPVSPRARTSGPPQGHFAFGAQQACGGAGCSPQPSASPRPSPGQGPSTSHGGNGPQRLRSGPQPHEAAAMSARPAVASVHDLDRSRRNVVSVSTRHVDVAPVGSNGGCTQGSGGHGGGSRNAYAQQQNVHQHQHQQFHHQQLKPPRSGDIVGEMEPDPLHEAIVRFCMHRPAGRYPLVRISRGVYLYGTKKLVLAIHNEKLMARIGGGFVNLDSYLVDADRAVPPPPAVPTVRRTHPR
eukprot:TRINITY_DN67606_c0_g1_i1.p1 TRINITY_DN67606_c0_g1~~TRINITY_DN67606_c0_g1_i1.p1  ORF type:complete len:1583 (-),score=336.98 TRINITY_DN67606_c0_g1_i1:27-4586(-)